MNVISMPQRVAVGVFIDIAIKRTPTLRSVYILTVTRQESPFAGSYPYRAENAQGVRLLLEAFRKLATANGEVLRIYNKTVLPDELIGISPEERSDVAYV